MSTTEPSPVWPPAHIEITASAAAEPPDPDLALLAAWRAGDRSAADHLIGRHHERIRRAIARKVPDSAVDDLVGEVLLALCENRDRIRSGATFKAYAIRIANNRIHDYYERRNKPLDVAELWRSSARHLGGDTTGPSGAQHRERRALEALRSLPLLDQQLLELYLWDDLSAPELALAFEVPQGTIRSRLERARKRLDAELGILDREERRLDDTLTDLDAWARALREELKPFIGRIRPPSS